MAKDDIIRSERGIRIRLLAPTGESKWFEVDPSSTVKRFFTDRVLVKEPGGRARLYYLSGFEIKNRTPVADEVF